MASAQPKLEAELAAVQFLAPAVPVISNVTALPHGAAEATRKLLVEQVTASVRWEASMRYLLEGGLHPVHRVRPGDCTDRVHEANRQSRSNLECLRCGQPGSHYSGP